MIATFIKITGLLVLLAPALLWPVMGGILLAKAQKASEYRFPSESLQPSGTAARGLPTSGQNIVWDYDTARASFFHRTGPEYSHRDLRADLHESGARALRYRMLSKKPDLPLFLAALVHRSGGHAVVERDWSNDIASSPTYVLKARVAPALLAELTAVDGNDPANIQGLLDRQHANPEWKAASQDVEPSSVPVRIEFTGPYVQLLSMQFDTKQLLGHFLWWFLGLVALGLYLAIMTGRAHLI